MKTDDQIRTEVRNHYSAVARGEARTACCAPVDAGTAARTLRIARRSSSSSSAA